MTQGEAIDALEALTAWTRTLAEWQATTDREKRAALIETFPRALADRCGAAIVDALRARGVALVNDEGAELAGPWSGLVLFARLIEAARAMGTTRGELVRLAIDHAAQAALDAPALLRVAMTPNMEAR